MTSRNTLPSSVTLGKIAVFQHEVIASLSGLSNKQKDV